MQNEGKSSEEEPPSLHWGLDPIFSAFARLYIKDILQMKESRQVPGIFFYKAHPIYKVDVLGTVVYKREREDFFCYGVDDGTGVINCLCWKDEQWKEGTETVKYKVEDPVLAIQISWMMEVPQLYRRFYDKPFQVPITGSEVEGFQSLPGLLGQVCHTLKDFLRETGMGSFHAHDLETVDSLVSLASRPLHSPSAQQESAEMLSTSKQVHNLIRQAVQILQQEGLVFRKVNSQEEVYQVTEQDQELHKVTKEIIKEDSQREKYAEKGCHFLHILSCVRESYSRNISEPAMHLVLSTLECNSDIISTADNHYTAL
ncbi:CST complex subunit STN1 isoform X2 [Amia ocellicauda]|uniref:CST complex subunit STN1 isoform X2 n=1 Tax=Amia ocellicauda TaxID=2972642 RepID=UPI003464225B